jgi:hypothetical protein
VADDFVYLVLYEQKVDESVDVTSGVTQVYDIGSLQAYTYIGTEPQVVFKTADFSDAGLWRKEFTHGSSAAAKAWVDVKLQRYASDYANSTRTEKVWKTGGGFLSKKTIHVETVTVTGLKDYYTHALKADYPIAVGFVEGPAASSLAAIRPPPFWCARLPWSSTPMR